MARTGRATRWALGLTGLAPLAPTLVGSAVNIWYGVTAIGDAVNVASRVEGVAAVLGEQLLVTAATRAALRREAALEELAPQRVKGQRDPIVVFRPMESSPSPRARRR